MSDNEKPIDDVKPDDNENPIDSKKKDDSNKKQPFIPLDKQSKHRQKEFHASQRGSWGGINPVTRKPPNPKAYNRRKTGR